MRGTVWLFAIPLLCGLLWVVDPPVLARNAKSHGRALAIGTGARARSDDPSPGPAKVLAVCHADLEILARIVKGECPPGTPFEGKVAVAAVVLNRVRSPRFADSISGVAHQRAQFSSYNPSNRARLYEGPVPPLAWKAARAALAGSDPTRGCTFFFNPHIVYPGWARHFEFVRRIGTRPSDTHDFYRHKLAPGP